MRCQSLQEYYNQHHHHRDNILDISHHQHPLLFHLVDGEAPFSEAAAAVVVTIAAQQS